MMFAINSIVLSQSQVEELQTPAVGWIVIAVTWTVISALWLASLYLSKERLEITSSKKIGVLQVKIAIGSDHAGFEYKEKIKQVIIDLGHEVDDFGTDSEEPVDYPLFIRPVARAVARGEVERGVVLGGSGNGEAMAANHYKGVRCALCWNVASARLARQHNDANMISLGARLVTEEDGLKMVRTWLETAFEGGRHLRRIQMLDL